MPFALLFSLVFHALLLGLTFGGQGIGLPGFGLPWQDRRIEVPNLRILLNAARGTAAEPSTEPVATRLPCSCIATVKRPSSSICSESVGSFCLEK